MAPEALRQAITARVAAPPSADAARVAEGLCRVGGASLASILFFGSRKTRARPDAYSAHDLVIAVDDYGSFYRALRASGQLRRPPALVALLNRLLPPNQVSVSIPGQGGETLRAKCAVVSTPTLRRETSVRRRDHFLAGRLFQPTGLLHARDEATRGSMFDALEAAHRSTLSWVRPWLPLHFGVDEYTQTLLAVSFRGEIRPEPEGRSLALWTAQQEYLRPVYGVLLEELESAGELRAEGGGRYSLARPVTRGESLRLRAYFARSLARATLRWAKYVVTFDDWLEFIVRKARRHTGQDIVLTERERRLPLVFLWPRVFKYLRHKDRHP